MKRIALHWANSLTKNRDLRKPAERHSVGLLASIISIGGNVFLVLLKAVFGILTNSITLIADAVHSASDIFSSIVVLLGFVLARRDPDPEHPHGHGRAEYLAGLAIALMLLGAGAGFAYTAYNRLVTNIYPNPSIAAIIAVFFSILIKEFMYHFSLRLGHQINSEALTGDAWHHRSDSLSSLIVLVALGGSYLGLRSLDAYLGFAVAAFIALAGFRIARQSCSSLLGKAPDDSFKNDVEKCARKIKGVIETHDLTIHDYGSRKVVTMHIGVNGQMSLDEAHEIAEKVENHVSDCFHCETVVHLDPR